MLVLSRKIGETIVIGDDVSITVVDVRDGKARLGIEAPKEVKVFREELIRNRDGTPKDPPQPKDPS